MNKNNLLDYTMIVFLLILICLTYFHKTHKTIDDFYIDEQVNWEEVEIVKPMVVDNINNKKNEMQFYLKKVCGPNCPSGGKCPTDQCPAWTWQKIAVNN